MAVNVSKAVSAVTLEEAKAHLRVEHNLENTLITSLILTATMAAETRLKRPIISREGEVMTGLCENVQTVPAAIKAWILVTIGYMYSNRELASVEKVERLPFFDSLLDAWRVYE